MIYITKVAAYAAVMDSIEKDDITKANEMMKIIAKTLKREKQDNVFTPYVLLETKKEEILFGVANNKIVKKEDG